MHWTESWKFSEKRKFLTIKLKWEENHTNDFTFEQSKIVQGQTISQKNSSKKCSIFLFNNVFFSENKNLWELFVVRQNVCFWWQKVEDVWNKKRTLEKYFSWLKNFMTNKCWEYFHKQTHRISTNQKLSTLTKEFKNKSTTLPLWVLFSIHI